MDFVQRIYLKDWPLILVNKWLERLIDIDNPDYIRPSLCEAIDVDFKINQRYTKDRFREVLFKINTCGGRLCKGTCEGRCTTAGNIERMPIFNRFSNFEPLYSEILSHFFFKLNDKINVYHMKYRIGILVLYCIEDRVDLDINNAFIKKEKNLIINQLSNYFYITDYTLVDSKNIFSHIKNFIDSVVIIIDSNFEQNTFLEEYYSVIQCFGFLKIFLIKTVDLIDYDNNAILDYFSLKFPRNNILIYDWMYKAENFPDYVKRELTMKIRLKVAICSRFVKKPTNHRKS